jgi:hypothetical protein
VTRHVPFIARSVSRGWRRGARAKLPSSARPKSRRLRDAVCDRCVTAHVHRPSSLCFTPGASCLAHHPAQLWLVPDVLLGVNLGHHAGPGLAVS